MESNNSMSRNISLLNDEKFIREVNYISETIHNKRKKPLALVLEIFQKGTALPQTSKRVLVTIKSRVPALKTLYIAERRRYSSVEGSGSLLAIGDPQLLPYTSEDSKDNSELFIYDNKGSCESKPKIVELEHKPLYNTKKRNRTFRNSKLNKGKCIFTTSVTAMNIETNVKIKTTNEPTKIDKATLIITNTTSEESFQSDTKTSLIRRLGKRVYNLEQKILHKIFLTSDEMLKSLNDDCPGHSRSKPLKRTFVDQYSHIAEKSAFNRNSQQATPLSPSKATAFDKGHSSEQYGRNFTTYDEHTARGRRQCASMPLNKKEMPKKAAERVNKIRNKLNPVRDYRLMDTVHYLAQGEFAPRDDGIKLTPSREAVLSDIIWEDVCRTNWPNTRLARRVQHSERRNARYELQRLIDSLLRERVSHVQRRRRKHYRIVKLNNRYESSNKRLGKTGDIIVAAHKNNDVRDVIVSDHGGMPMLQDAHRLPIPLKNTEQKRQIPRRLQVENSLPGTSSNVSKCIQESSQSKHIKGKYLKKYNNKKSLEQPRTSKESSDHESTSINSKVIQKNPRLVVKRVHEITKRKSQSRNLPSLEHYIVLPTLVARTDSNIKRQKKFSELYQQILNGHYKKDICNAESIPPAKLNKDKAVTNKKDISFNINIPSSDSDNYYED